MSFVGPREIRAAGDYDACNWIVHGGTALVWVLSGRRHCEREGDFALGLAAGEWEDRLECALCCQGVRNPVRRKECAGIPKRLGDRRRVGTGSCTIEGFRFPPDRLSADENIAAWQFAIALPPPSGRRRDVEALLNTARPNTARSRAAHAL